MVIVLGCKCPGPSNNNKNNNNRPDITVIDKMDDLVTFIDVAVPADRRVTDKDNEKIEKYQDLRIEIECLWNKKT